MVNDYVWIVVTVKMADKIIKGLDLYEEDKKKRESFRL